MSRNTSYYLLKKIRIYVLLTFRRNVTHRPSDSDHVEQKAQLDLYGVQKKDAMTYHIRPDVHLEKTSDVLIIRPDHVETIPEWFIHNGEQTIAFLEEMWRQGKLENTVENFAQFESAIKVCVQEDIDRFERSGFKGATCSELEQTSAISIAVSDCERFSHTIAYTDEAYIDKPKLKRHIKQVVKDGKSIAAFIYNQPETNLWFVTTGRNLSSVVARSRGYEKDRFLNGIRNLVEHAETMCPELKDDASFTKNKLDLMLIMDGQGSYAKELQLHRYNKLVKDVKNVRCHCALYGRNKSVLKD